MHFQPQSSPDCENDLYGVEFGHGSKYFAKIHTFHLRAILGHQPCFETHHHAVGIFLRAKHSRTLYGLAALGQQS